MFIYIPCLALLACLHSAVGAPIRFAKIYGLSRMPSSVYGRDANSFWTQKQRPQNLGDRGLWVSAFDPYTSVVIGREQDCRSATVFKNDADMWSAVMIGPEQDCRSATAVEKTVQWPPIVHWARRPDVSAAAGVYWPADETVSMTTYDQ
ncbi:unnamed protein product [Aphis gossypii]|uniref:Uncharacterized protein n=1 Tax=Aphis gossypii TaxID=80765 RepID=A0A9P0JHH3_APHGO|nr:unnamed protein product [Aphis gossypii]